MQYLSPMIVNLVLLHLRNALNTSCYHMDIKIIFRISIYLCSTPIVLARGESYAIQLKNEGISEKSYPSQINPQEIILCWMPKINFDTISLAALFSDIFIVPTDHAFTRVLASLSLFNALFSE